MSVILINRISIRASIILGIVLVILVVGWNQSSDDFHQQQQQQQQIDIHQASNKTINEPLVLLTTTLQAPEYGDDFSDINSCDWAPSCNRCLNLQGCGWNGRSCVIGNWNGPMNRTGVNDTLWLWNTCNASEVNRTYFNDILVVIYWNKVRPSRVPFTAYFRRIFPNMLLVGSDRPVVIGEGNLSSTVLPATWFTCKTGGEYCQYYCLTEVMQSYPRYRGYLMLHYDVLFNYWNTVGRFDRNKIWLTKPGSDAFVSCYRPVKHWIWWSFKHPNAPEGGEQGIEALYKSLPPSLSQSINSTCNHPTQAYPALPVDCGFSDAFYIPARYVNKYLFYSSLFYQYRIFLEIAVPTMLSWMVLDKTTDISYWENFSFYSFKEYTIELDLMHAVKFNESPSVWKFYDIWKNKTLAFPSAGFVRVPRVGDLYMPSYRIAIEDKIIDIN